MYKIGRHVFLGAPLLTPSLSPLPPSERAPSYSGYSRARCVHTGLEALHSRSWLAHPGPSLTLRGRTSHVTHGCSTDHHLPYMATCHIWQPLVHTVRAQYVLPQSYTLVIVQHSCTHHSPRVGRAGQQLQVRELPTKARARRPEIGRRTTCSERRQTTHSLPPPHSESLSTPLIRARPELQRILAPTPREE